MESTLFQVGRVLLQIHLLVVFLHFFGLPAIRRFESREVGVEIFLRRDGDQLVSGDGRQDEKGYERGDSSSCSELGKTQVLFGKTNS